MTTRFLDCIFPLNLEEEDDEVAEFIIAFPLVDVVVFDVGKIPRAFRSFTCAAFSFAWRFASRFSCLNAINRKSVISAGCNTRTSSAVASGS